MAIPLALPDADGRVLSLGVQGAGAQQNDEQLPG
jgi:hypothetical protein